MEQVHQFRMTHDFLLSVIKEQAGTHEKSLLKVVINSVDAGATDYNLTHDKKDYVLSDENKIQIALREYCRPDRGIFTNFEGLSLTKEQIDKAIIIGNQVSEEKKLEAKGYDLHEDVKKELINIYAGYAFLKELNFDVIFEDTFNLKEERLPNVLVVGYSYHEHTKNKLEYEVGIGHCIFLLARNIVKEHYGRVYPVKSFEELKQLTIDGVDKEKVQNAVVASPEQAMQNVQNLRNSSTKPAESKATNDLN